MEARSSSIYQSDMRVLNENEISSVGGGPLPLIGIIVTAAAANIGNTIYKITTGIIKGYEEEMAKE